MSEARDNGSGALGGDGPLVPRGLLGPRPPTGLAPRTPPAWASWRYLGILPGREYGDRHVWACKRLLVLSTLALMEFRGEQCWQWLVSVSVTDANGHRSRASDDEIARALNHFGMVGAEEDNHLPGVSRSFFRLCDADPTAPSVCECKETEEQIAEPDGFVWSKETAGSAEEARAASDSRIRLGRMGLLEP